MESSTVKQLMNQQINDSISQISDISSMFKNPNLDLSSLRITTESDFILGAVWASSINYFIRAFAEHYNRLLYDEEHQEAILTLLERGQEIREAIGRITAI